MTPAITRASPGRMYGEDDDVHTRPARVRFACGEITVGCWLRRYLAPGQGWAGETTQVFTVLAVNAQGGVLLKELSTGRELTRRKGYLATSAYWELL